MHAAIHRQAVTALPTELFGYYNRIQPWLVARAGHADKRVRFVEGEYLKHYCHLDLIGDSLELMAPNSQNQADGYWGERRMRTIGYLPYAILSTKAKLVQAMKTKDHVAIIQASADLGHYLADAHVPLHCHSNYDGQLSKQTGIHALWETEIPQSLSLTAWQPNTVELLAAPTQAIWQIVKESARLADSTLWLHRKAGYLTKHKYVPVMKKGSKRRFSYSPSFISCFRDAAAIHIRSRYSASVRNIAAMWYTCWVEAGQPSLLASDIDALADKKQTVFSAWLEQQREVGGQNLIQAPEHEQHLKDHE